MGNAKTEEDPELRGDALDGPEQKRAADHTAYQGKPTRIASCTSTAKKTPCMRTAWTSKTTIHRRWALPRAPNCRAADDVMIGAHASEGEPMVMGDIMTALVVTVDMDDRLERVKEIFDAKGFHHLPVTDENEKLSGIVSDRDLLRALSPYVGSAAETTRDLATLNKRVHQIMTRRPLTLRPQSTIAEAVNLLLTQHISCIPIIDDDFKPVGIVSWRDLLKSLAPG